MSQGESLLLASLLRGPNANAELLAYWDRLEDRLYKIRHCLDINGQRRMLPLYQPPIDPMQLVRAKAMGLSLDQVRYARQDVAHLLRWSTLGK